LCPLEEQRGRFVALVEGVQRTLQGGCQSSAERAGLLEVCKKRRVGTIKSRIDYRKTAPDGISALSRLENYVRQSGLDPALLELVKLRASQINGYCIDMHTKDERKVSQSSASTRSLPGAKRHSLRNENAPRWLGRKR